MKSVEKANLATLKDISAQSKINPEKIAEYVDLTEPMQVSKGTDRLTILQGVNVVKVPIPISADLANDSIYEKQKNEILQIIREIAKKGNVQLPSLENIYLVRGVIANLIEFIASQSQQYKNIQKIIVPTDFIDENGITTQKQVRQIVIKSEEKEKIEMACDSNKLLGTPLHGKWHTLTPSLDEKDNALFNFGFDEKGQVVIFDYG